MSLESIPTVLEELYGSASVESLERLKKDIQQLRKVKRALAPTCCHVTGSHDPTHWRKQPSVFCDVQKARAWDRATRLLRLHYYHAISEPGCRLCRP